MNSLVSGAGTVGSVQTASGQQTTASPRLIRAANEFESQMMQELLKPLAAGMTSDAEDNDGAMDGSMDSLAGFGAESLGSALAHSGGFGIASGIIRELSHNQTPAASGGVTKVVNQRSDLNTLKRL